MDRRTPLRGGEPLALLTEPGLVQRTQSGRAGRIFRRLIVFLPALQLGCRPLSGKAGGRFIGVVPIQQAQVRVLLVPGLPVFRPNM